MLDLLPFEFIAQKQSGSEHDPRQIERFVQGFMEGDVADYQMSAWMMAVYFQGMTRNETAALTQAMISTGRRLSFSASHSPLGDKHSTGGVGDKITLLLAPLMAAAGVGIPTISGRGLGFTGGTLDKLEAIPGFSPNLTTDELKEKVVKNRIAFGAQTDELVPADRRMYALRDVTSTIRSYPLITASILSKKLAEDVDAMVFDVKCGHGAFMQTFEEALELAHWLVEVAGRFELRSAAIITNMDAPLGNTVGNWLEVDEAASALRGDGCPEDIRLLTMTLGSTLLSLTGQTSTPDQGWKQLDKIWQGGDAYEVFLQSVADQGGDSSVFDASEPPHRASSETVITAPRSGIINQIFARDIGFASVRLGGGRRKTTDAVDPAAGIIFHKQVGDSVQEDEPIATLYGSSAEQCDSATQLMASAILIKDETPEQKPLIQRVVLPGLELDWPECQSSNLQEMT